MVERASLPRTLASLVGLLFIVLEGFLLLGGSFGEFETRFAAPTDAPEPLTLNGFPYSLLAAATILLLVFAGWVAGAGIDRSWMGPRRLKAAGAMLIVASLLLFTGLMLLTRIEMQSDDIIRYSVGAGAYILIGLPWAAAVALWVAAAEPWKAR